MAVRRAIVGEGHEWEFKARFRRNAFGWKSQPAIARLKEARAEIKRVAKKDPALAAEGAVALLERLSPALERVDSSSGAIGSAVNAAIAELVPLIAGAPVAAATREAWLERLFDAHAADQIPYIEQLAEHWGELCASKELASVWADRLLDITRGALSPDKALRGHFHGTAACLSALYRAERFDELIELLNADVLFSYKSWAVRALAASGKKAEAIRYAEACRSPWASDAQIDGLCEEILLSSGLVDEAYARYGVRPHDGGSYLASFRALSKRYPHKPASELLRDLVATTPGDEGKWFAAAKDAGLYEEALALATRTPCDPKTLTRAARDYGLTQPAFATSAGLLALHWLAQGYGYEVTGADVLEAYRCTLTAAERNGNAPEVAQRIRASLAALPAESVVRRLLERALASQGFR